MHKINCILSQPEYDLLWDILGHVGYDDNESVTMSALKRKLSDIDEEV